MCARATISCCWEPRLYAFTVRCLCELYSSLIEIFYKHIGQIEITLSSWMWSFSGEFSARLTLKVSPGFALWQISIHIKSGLVTIAGYWLCSWVNCSLIPPCSACNENFTVQRAINLVANRITIALRLAKLFNWPWNYGARVFVLLSFTFKLHLAESNGGVRVFPIGA